MQLPRRVPWASLSELEQLCSWIYSDETDFHSRQLAVNKVTYHLFPFRFFKPPIKSKIDERCSVISLEVYYSTITRFGIYTGAFDCDSSRRFGVTAPWFTDRAVWLQPSAVLLDGDNTTS